MKLQPSIGPGEGADEDAVDATYAALEVPRTFGAAPEPIRSVLSHSKSHPRMLESASAVFFPACDARVNRRGDCPASTRLSREVRRADALDHPRFRAGNATSHVWPLGALAELLDKYARATRRSRLPTRVCRTSCLLYTSDAADE